MRLRVAIERPMTGFPPSQKTCNWTGKRARQADYMDHLGSSHPETLRKVGFKDALSLEGLPIGPLRRIHVACVERETLEAQRSTQP
jgi:hypothetical protein